MWQNHGGDGAAAGQALDHSRPSAPLTHGSRASQAATDPFQGSTAPPSAQQGLPAERRQPDEQQVNLKQAGAAAATDSQQGRSGGAAVADGFAPASTSGKWRRVGSCLQCCMLAAVCKTRQLRGSRTCCDPWSGACSCTFWYTPVDCAANAVPCHAGCAVLCCVQVRLDHCGAASLAPHRRLLSTGAWRLQAQQSSSRR